MAQRLGTSRLALSFAPGITSFPNINQSGKKLLTLFASNFYMAFTSGNERCCKHH